jgi:hypothetical protein
VKNKVAPPFRQAEFDIMYGKGISREGSLLDLSVEMAIVKKSGAWFTYEGEQLGQGRENAKSYLLENPRSWSRSPRSCVSRPAWVTVNQSSPKQTTSRSASNEPGMVMWVPGLANGARRSRPADRLIATNTHR